MPTSRKGKKKDGADMSASDGGGEEAEEEQPGENATGGTAATTTPRRQQQPPQQQGTRRSTRTRKRPAAESPTNGAESSGDKDDGDDDDNDSSKPTTKKRRRAADDEATNEDADMNETTTAAVNDNAADMDDDDAPAKKPSAKNSDNRDEKMSDSAGVDASVNGGSDENDTMKVEEEYKEEEEDRKMPAAGKVNGHSHHTATATEAATTLPSVTFASPPEAAAAASTTTSRDATNNNLPMATNLRLPHQHTPGKPLHETEILRPPPFAAAAPLQPQQPLQGAAGSSMRLHLEPSTSMANSPYTIPTPQPPKRNYSVENGDLAEAHQTTATTENIAGAGDDNQWHSPTHAAPLQQGQQQSPLQHEPQQPAPQPEPSKAPFGALLQSTLAWCVLILLLQVACGSYWMNPFLSTIVRTSKSMIAQYKHGVWTSGQYIVVASGERLLSQQRLLALLGGDVVTTDFVALSTIHHDDDKDAVVVVASGDNEDDDDDHAVELDDSELDKELEKEPAEEKDDDDDDDGKELDHHEDADDESVWTLEFEQERDKSIDDNNESFELELPEEEPDDFGDLDDGEKEFDIASLQDDDGNDDEEDNDDNSTIKALLEAEQEKNEDEVDDDEEEEEDGIHNMTEMTSVLTQRLEHLEERRKVVVDKRRKIRRDLENKKMALQADKDVFTRTTQDVHDTLDSVSNEASDASRSLENKISDMNYLLEKLSEALEAERVAGSEELDVCLEQLGKEYEGLLIDLSTLELWNAPIADDEEQVQCNSDEFAVFGRDQAMQQIQDFQDEIANESRDMLNDETFRKSVEDFVTAYAATQPMPTRQKQKSIASRSQNGPTTHAIKLMIAARLEHERADQTGRVDYAALYSGASVIRTGERATSPSLVDSLPIVNRLAAALRLRFYGHGPEAALTPTHPTTALGQCWAFGPDPRESLFASFSIRLAKPIFIERISIEHPSAHQVQDNIRTAIRSFRVLGFEDEEAQGTAWRLGSYVYEVVDDDNTVNNNKTRVRQEFEIPHQVSGVNIPRLRSISLAIDSNWGMPYSCLYRVRVHGGDR